MPIVVNVPTWTLRSLYADCRNPPRSQFDFHTDVPSGGPAGANNRTARKRWTDPRNQDGADVLVQAFRQTRQIGLSVVLIMG